MIYLLMLVAAAGGIFLYSNQALADFNPDVILRGGYPDIDPTLQGGGYNTDYDDFFLEAARSCNVPFALMKAHAKRESAFDPSATHYDDPKNGSSYGLMQVEFVAGSTKYLNYGYGPSQLGDGSALFDPELNTFIAGKLIRENLDRFGNLRDAINAYNTGVAESKRPAPNNYVNDVMRYYQNIINQKVSLG